MLDPKRSRGELMKALAQHGAACVPAGDFAVSFELWRNIIFARMGEKFKENSCCKLDVGTEALSLDIHNPPDNKLTFDVKASLLDRTVETPWMRVAHTALRFAEKETLEILIPELELIGWKSDRGFPNSVLRHVIYPKDGWCGSHTDYGLFTMQVSNASGFEGNCKGTWRQPVVPPGCMLVYGGDMLEALTKDTASHVVSLKHRVRVTDAARQSHILFVQPGDDDICGSIRFGNYKLMKTAWAKRRVNG